MQKNHARLPSGQGSKPQTSGICHTLQQNVTIYLFGGVLYGFTSFTDGVFCFFDLRIHAGSTKAGWIFRSSIIIFAGHQDHLIIPAIRKVTNGKTYVKEKHQKCKRVSISP